MKENWSTKSAHVAAVRQVLRDAKKAVSERKRTNVTRKPPSFSREEFWDAMLGCQLSTQQRWPVVSGFLERKPFPLALGRCDQRKVESLVLRELQAHGGIRFGPTIASQAARNLTWLNAGGWREVESYFRSLLVQRSRPPRPQDAKLEREAARFVDDNLKGFGPKQSRHLWLWLGLTRYEIPLDSRMTQWLNENKLFPLKISAQALGDRDYYEFVLDAVQALCRAAGVLPCIFDAAVFSIKDQAG